MDYKNMKELGKKKCTSLHVVQKSEGILGGGYKRSVSCNVDNTILNVKIEQSMVRKISLLATKPLSIENIWNIYASIERLLMMLDGRFYDIESAIILGNEDSKNEYALYVKGILSKRLAYYKTASFYCYNEHKFLMFDVVLSPELILKWIKLEDELDIVHPFVLYNIAETMITCDVKCANLIEVFEPLVEIVKAYKNLFPSLKPSSRETTLKMCIDAIILKYGKDIFYEEYSNNKEKFLQVLVNTRNRIMHIKRHQSSEKYLSGEESVLYLVKLFHLYRVVIFSILDIDYSQYESVLKKSVNHWNSWKEVLNKFLSCAENDVKS